MTKCERVRQHLEAATAGELEPELACHVHDCTGCREELVHATQFREGGAC